MLHECVSRGPMRAAVWRSLFFTGFMASVDSQTSWVRRRPPAHRRRFGSRMSFTHQHWAGRTWKDRSVFLTLGEPLLYVRPSAGFTEWSMMESDGGINAADGRGRLWADRERVLCTETRQLTGHESHSLTRIHITSADWLLKQEFRFLTAQSQYNMSAPPDALKDSLGRFPDVFVATKTTFF